MKNVRIYTTQWCGYCDRAKSLLEREGVPFEEIDVEGDRDTRTWLLEASGQRTVPQIFIGEQSIGGSDDLATLVRSNRLDGLLDRPESERPAKPKSLLGRLLS